MEAVKFLQGLDKIDLAVCLDGIGLNGPLYIHKTPKSQASSKYFIDALKSNKYGVAVEEVHKKINLGDERTWWQHERFAFKKVSFFHSFLVGKSAL